MHGLGSWNYPEQAQRSLFYLFLPLGSQSWDKGWGFWPMGIA